MNKDNFYEYGFFVLLGIIGIMGELI